MDAGLWLVSEDNENELMGETIHERFEDEDNEWTNERTMVKTGTTMVN